ncbi:cytochrome c3 family protein [Thermosulfurimonas dismutans]|uniref:Cytochrome c family protein n=1 Tax=Thermosulfurimonas dismutans TaxID=999894 RepID=A0A179D505_9BACT|nr:cytochrome c3 family protein [Thermosulfurimonas dismutans]OAQ20688.1 Cytochrome c family protein [Thermosulfurimonas dismutans]
MKKIFLLLGIFFVIGLFFHSLPSMSQEGSSEEEAEYPTEPIIFTQPLKAVLFEHKIHVEEAGLSCEDCHEEVFPMEAGSTQENEDFTMEALYNGKYCGTCHDGESAFASNTRCATCHIGVMGLKRLSGQESQTGHEGH